MVNSKLRSNMKGGKHILLFDTWGGCHQLISGSYARLRETMHKQTVKGEKCVCVECVLPVTLLLA
jgi:hypothetical protein